MTVSEGDIRGPARPATPWLLRRANRRYRLALRAALADAGFGDLPPEGWWALDALAHGTRDATGLVAVMGISRQGASKLVEALVAAGYVRRGPDERDRRRVDLTLSDRGAAAARCMGLSVAGTDAELVAELGAEGFALVREVLGGVAGPALPGGEERPGAD